MQILIAPLENIILGEKTKFSAEEAAGQTVLSVENTQGFASNDLTFLIFNFNHAHTTIT